MRTVNAVDFTEHFDEFAEMVQSAPVTVMRAGRPIGVFLSTLDYEHLTLIEDSHWAALAEAAVTRGDSLSTDESVRWVRQRLTPER